MDGQGSTSAVTDNSGNVLEQYEYNAQGQVVVALANGTAIRSSAILNSIFYTGRSYDYETGNYFYRARYYNPVLGRFISRDPLSGAEFSQGTNLYAYCSNNLLNATDPTGMCLKDGKLTLGGDYQMTPSLDYPGQNNSFDNALKGYGPDVNVQSDSDIDEQMNNIFDKIDSNPGVFSNSLSSTDGFWDFKNFMGGEMDTDYHGTNGPYGYFGVEHPELDGLTMSGHELNYMGVGAGFAAAGWSPTLTEAATYGYDLVAHNSAPTSNVYSATQAGYNAYNNR